MMLLVRWIHFVTSKCGDGFLIELINNHKLASYGRTSIIRILVCHFNVRSVQISKFVQISELSDKIHFLAS